MNATWPRVSLNELIRLERRPVEVVADREYQEIGTYSYGRGIFHKRPRSGLEVGDKDLFLMKEGDLILQITFAWEGAIALCSKAEDGLFGSVRYPTYRVDEARCFAPFLVKYLCTRQGLDQIGRICPGSAGRNRVLALKRLPEITVPLPTLNEQHRIVARIEELAEKVDEACGLRSTSIDEVAALRASQSRKVFEALPDEAVPLEDVCSAIIDNLHSNPFYAEGGTIPCIRSSDVGFGTLDLEGARRTDEAEYIKRTVRGEPQADDIVLVREGGGTGKCALVLPEHRFSLGQRVMMIRPDQSRVVPKFFLYQLLSPTIQEDQIRPLSKGSASPHLNIGALRRFPFVLPNMNDQARIVAELDALQAKVDAVKALQAETAAELDAMLPAILDKAFKGEL